MSFPKIKNSVFEKNCISRNIIRIITNCKNGGQTSRLLSTIYDVCTITDTSETARNEDSDYPMITFVRFNNRKMLLNLSVEDTRNIDGHVIDCGSSTYFSIPMAFDFIEKVSNYMKRDKRFEKVESIEIGNVLESNGEDSPRVWIRACREDNGVVIYYWKFTPSVIYKYYEDCVTVGHVIIGDNGHDPDIDYETIKECIERKQFNYHFVDALMSKNIAIEISNNNLNLVGVVHDYEYYMKTNKRTAAYSNLEQLSNNKYVCYVYVPSSVEDLEIVTKIIKVNE